MSRLIASRFVPDSCPAIISKCRDIYSNLAFENWLYTNVNFTYDSSYTVDTLGATLRAQLNPADRKPLLFVWRNEKAVVFGRHQNPWIETRCESARRLDVKLARRHSGGGCVYHDPNNLNISIISKRQDFNRRQENLEFVADFLDRTYGIKSIPTPRHDLILRDSKKKITGSAAKLGRFNCYHHFTLLVNVQLKMMHSILRQSVPDCVETNSTQSTRAEVENLKSIKPSLTPDTIAYDLALAFRNHHHYDRQNSSLIKTIDSHYMDKLPGFNDMYNELVSWDWIYGKTPRFRLKRKFSGITNTDLEIVIDINKGLIESISSEPRESTFEATFSDFVGLKFDLSEVQTKVDEIQQKESKHNGRTNKEKSQLAMILGYLRLIVAEIHS